MITPTTYFYLPQDRRQSLLQDALLPKFDEGTALFADISGFTPLTENLTRQLGPRRGIEELLKRINAVYDALISLVEQHQGSVISFAGDAITCWFPRLAGNPQAASSYQALSAALSMQTALKTFPEISLKVALSSGRVCRLAVGDPRIQLFDTLAGATITRLAAAEHLAGPGEIIADLSTTADLAELSTKIDWANTRSEAGENFGLLSAARAKALAAALPEFTPVRDLDRLPAEIPLGKIRNYVSEAVFTREQSGLGEFLTELRPGVAVFVRFMGIDFDEDAAAEQKLDTFIRQVQQIVARYEGTLLQLTTGDKGNYLYICFGAPAAHEDDATRAVSAALALHEMAGKLEFLEQIQTGISSGTLRVGAYGGTTRRTYGALGDEVNVAARLMTLALPGEILLTSRVQQQLSGRFALNPRLPVTVKGKTAPVEIFGVTQVQRLRNTRLQEPEYPLPMVGREAELALISRKLELARQGKSQVIGITAEAGLGKSRLVAEAITEAKRQGFSIYSGACESSGTNTPYLAWKAVWQTFFELDSLYSTGQQISRLETMVSNHAPHRLPALPLLGPLVDVPVGDNDFTFNLEPKNRRSALRALLEDCLKAATREAPALVVLEDVHWIDPLSHELLLGLARGTANEAVCFILAYRPFDLKRLQAPQVEALGHFSQLKLTELLPAEASQLIRAKVDQLFSLPSAGLERGTISEALLEHLINKGQGNPFFLEEILNYLRDRDITPFDEKAVQELELPSSLHTLILSRIDQLSESQKVILKVASIIGRLFPFAWLHGYYPGVGETEMAKTDLAELARLDITPLDTPEPDLTYLFKHIVTQEVAYESLTFAARARLHEQLAEYLQGQDAEKYLNLLAYHYGRSENSSKQREYFQKAGDAARAAYANEAALDYYERLAPLLSAPDERVDLLLRWGAVLELVGRKEKAEQHYREALALTEENSPGRVQVQLALAKYYRLRSDFQEALWWLDQARANRAATGDRESLGQILIETGIIYQNKGEYDKSVLNLQEGLAVEREIGNKRNISLALNVMGNTTKNRGNFLEAKAFHEESLLLRREIGDKWSIAASIMNLGNLLAYLGDFSTARKMLEESLTDFRQVGDKDTLAASLNNLGTLVYKLADYDQARTLYEECLAIAREIGNKMGCSMALHNLANAIYYQGDAARARTLHNESLQIRHEIGIREGVAESHQSLGIIAYDEGDWAQAESHFKESLLLRQEIGQKKGILDTLVRFIGLLCHKGEWLRTAYLMGALEPMDISLYLTQDQNERQVYTNNLTSIRAALGDEEFQTAFEAGKKLTQDEAVQLALEGI